MYCQAYSTYHCRLTPELSRGAHVASGGVALAYTASAATKQRRLERIVRPLLSCTTAVRKVHHRHSRPSEHSGNEPRNTWLPRKKSFAGIGFVRRT